jgi:signal transduction histidine kinase
VLKPTSIGVRLALVNAAALAVAMIALGVVLFLLVDRALLRGADGILVDELAEIALPLQESPLPEELQRMIDTEVREHPSATLAFRVTGADGSTVASSPSGVWAMAPPAPGDIRTVMPPGDPVRHRLVGRRVVSPSLGPVDVEAAMRLRFADAAIESLVEVCVLLLPVLLAVALAAGYLLSRSALAPLERMDTAARRIGTGPPGDRLPRTGSGDELDRLAETLNDMLGRLEEASARNLRFAGDVAHEVRTPLSTIRARLESMPAGGEPLAATIREVERLEALVKSLLLICRADEKREGPGSDPVDLSAVAGEVAEFFGPVAAARGIRFGNEVPPGLRVRGDPDSLRRALANLVDNALHACDPGGEVILRGDAAGGRVRAEVLDRGCGVPPESRGRIFERFFRVAEGRARNPGGSGLGLALVRAVARAHGGDAAYAPREGGGSVFSIELPGE